MFTVSYILYLKKLVILVEIVFLNNYMTVVDDGIVPFKYLRQ